MNIINHRHVHPESTIAAFVRLRKELDECARVINEELGPVWVSITETCKLTEDNWDYLLVRVHDRLPTKKKECMFEKENNNDRS